MDPMPTSSPGGRAASGRVNPCQLFLLAFPIYWTVGGISTGGGADGEGACAPSPVSGFSMPASPTPPGLRPPPPPEGRGQSWRYPEKAVSGRGNPRAGSLFRLFPLHRTVGGIPAPRGDTWGGPHPGERTPAPALSSGFPHTLDRGRYLHGGTSSPGGGPHPGERTPAPALSSGFPHTLDRGRYLHGGTSSPRGGAAPGE